MTDVSAIEILPFIAKAMGDGRDVIEDSSREGGIFVDDEIIALPEVKPLGVTYDPTQDSSWCLGGREKRARLDTSSTEKEREISETHILASTYLCLFVDTPHTSHMGHLQTSGIPGDWWLGWPGRRWHLICLGRVRLLRPPQHHTNSSPSCLKETFSAYVIISTPFPSTFWCKSVLKPKFGRSVE